MLEPIVHTLASAVDPIAAALQAGEHLPPLGLRRSARLPALAALAQKSPRPIILITDRADRALTQLDELRYWAPETLRLYFPEPNPLFYEDAAWGENTRRDRLTALTILASYHIPGAVQPPATPILVVTARALMTRTLPRREFLKGTRSLKRGQTVSMDELVRSWAALGYEPVTTVIASGQFARRGGILDVWPPSEPQPYRLEFFGDEVDSLRPFDPSTQRTYRTQPGSPSREERVLITPAREFLLPPGYVSPLPAYAQEGHEPINEFHIPLVHPAPASLIDYLPRQALVLVDDWAVFQDTVSEIEEQSVGLRKDFIVDGILPPDFPIPYLTWPEIEDALSLHSVVELGPSSSDNPSTLAEAFSPGPRFGGRLKDAIDFLLHHTTQREPVWIVSRQQARLAELWYEAKKATNLEPARLLEPVFVEGSLGEGWSFTPSDELTLHLLTDGELFGWRRPEPRQRARRAVETPEAAYADLQVGDWVVHVDHGIGRFQGLVMRSVDEVVREYLSIQYAQNDMLYVPVYQADRVTRYVGPDNRVPSPTRLGGTEWRGVKARAKEAVEEVAEDLLDLYAQRQVVEGHSFGQDSTWQQELEASFPYVETEDQLRVIQEVKQDMESLRPMDRLICGDVGYGKTEVALRAAFKAVLDGKQVAILVPTTVLAQQHYYTFRERLTPFSAEVEMLSRFRTPQQQREILRRLANGNLDIIIGTHRLLQDDVKFKDLGLLIIDEEQRFGVTHKETLKQMRTEVDVLTLTATPIPRTLYMALTGVRDISTINTPPEERLPIITHVGPYSPRLVRQAILRELERGGQVFFVHNRVQTIEAMHRHLAKLVPEARLAVGHGQMDEGELSRVMDQFTSGEVDVLLSTSIIESGLDIPNANTLIVDRADTFGLAQLYQLRGRVGRGAQRAYAYFFRHRKKLPTIDGRQRLETIAENTQLGAGYSIAMRDLEIRGAGDLLGTRQSGYIASVGFHLYTRLLADAVRRMRQSAKADREGLREATHETLAELARLPSQFLEAAEPQRPLINVDLPVPTSIPDDYVPDKAMRLRLYRRIADLRTPEEIEAVVHELADRFGPLPDPVQNLLYQVKVKLLAEQTQVNSLSGEKGQLVLRFPALPEGVSQRDFPQFPPEVRAGKNSLWMPIREGWQARLVEMLIALASAPQVLPLQPET